MSEPYYSDDHVTLYHGDCREVTAWLEADVLVTDPPYGMAYVGGGPRSGYKNRAPGTPVSGDRDTTARDDVLAAWGGGPALVFGTWKVARPLGVRERLIWHKRNTNPGLATGTPWSPAEEEIYVLGGGFVGPRGQNVIPTDEARSSQGGLAFKVGHPTPKPVGLMERLITNCPPGVIADPFAGSGATLLAARHLDRLSIGIEIDEAYCELIAKRLQQGAFDFGGAA